MATLISEMRKSLRNELDDFRQKLGIKKIGSIEQKIFNDIVRILCTDPVQTLKHRYQLGLVYKVLDNDKAKHSRLEHTIGTVAKCIVVADLINKNTIGVNVRLTELDVRELAVAAALHDCGHLPVSHATERGYYTITSIDKGITHEERILPLIINPNSFFHQLRTIVLSWKKFNPNSFYRIACIICPDVTEDYEQNIHEFIPPKRAIQQLLVSDIDMDRLDYVLRDAQKLNYRSVTVLEDKIVEYVKGLTLYKYKSLLYSKGNIDEETFYKSKEENVELCLSKENVENVFYLLVGRVLLYKYIYFSSEVRSFEGILTYLVGELLKNKVSLQPLKLIAMTDDYFIEHYLEELVSYIDSKKNIANHLKEKYVNVLKFEKARRFKFLMSVYADDIYNPRLKEEFEKNINNRSYVENLRNYLNYSANKLKKTNPDKNYNMERADLLFDVFNLKTGGGKLLVKSKPEKDNEEPELYTLKKTMNGSNMHRLCSETRLDIYIKSDLIEGKENFILKQINKFFRNI